jgi:hypothetical protein
VVHHQDLPGAQQELAHRQSEDDVLCHGAARIADHMSVSFCQPENPMHVKARVHAGQDRNAGAGAFRRL